MAEQHAALQPDEDVNEADSSLGEEVAQSTASLASSILQYRKENGRTYHSYKDGTYNFPNDEMENERLGGSLPLFSLRNELANQPNHTDLQHHIFYLTLGGKLGLSPPNDKATKVGRVLDLGTGTGIWAMDFGDEHPESEVIGVDLSPTQPNFVPVNVSFQIDDFEDTWTFSKPFDYIHSRMMNASVSNWTEYLKKCFENLNPGGHLELQEFALPRSDDGTLRPEHALQRSMSLLSEAAVKLNRAFVDLDKLKDMMTAAGFVDVKEVHYKWPSNTWPKDKRHKEIGVWNNENVTTGLHGFLLVLTRGLGWAREEVEVIAAHARKDVNNRSIHAYWPVCVVYGKKPEAVLTD